MLKSAHNFFCLFHNFIIKHVILHGPTALRPGVNEAKNSAVLYEFATCTAVCTRVQSRLWR